MNPPDAPWLEPGVVAWCQLLLDSYRRWVGLDLIERGGTPRDQAMAVFEAQLVIVSHGVQGDPILNYGNRRALELWEMDWEELTRTPSRLTAEPMEQGEREQMLERAAQDGYIDHYRGVRISRTGRRFLVEGAVVWNVVDSEGVTRGQAASFATWTNLTG